MASLDLRIMRFVAHHRIGVVTDVARGAMRLGLSPTAAAVVCLAGAVYVGAQKRWRLGGSVAVAFGLALVAAWGLKAEIGRPRPPRHLALIHPLGSAMPSTHAAFTAAVAVAACSSLGFLEPPVRRAVWAGVSALVVGTGFCLVYLGAHWPSDVLVGWALGIGVGAVVAWALRDLPNGPPPLTGHPPDRVDVYSAAAS